MATDSIAAWVCGAPLGHCVRQCAPQPSFEQVGNFATYARRISGNSAQPLLHGSFAHLILNTVPLVTLGSFVAFYGTRIFLAVSLWIMLLSGAALWLLGRSAYHVGASSVLFGYFGYLVARGWYERSVTALLVALLILGLYGGMVWGVVPTRSYISWEGHLFGLLAGVLVARLATPQQRATPVPNLTVR